MKKLLYISISAIVFLIILFSISAKIMSKESTEEITDRSLLDVQERGKLVAGSDVPYGVMEFFDENNEVVGIDADIAREIASQLGVELEIMDYEWDDLFIDVKSGGLDIAISSMTITPERSQEMLFSVPYFNGGQVMVVRSGDESVKTPNDLVGKKIGVQAGTTGLEEALKYAKSDFIVEYAGLDSPEGTTGEGMIGHLISGEIDVIIVDYVAAIGFIKQDTSMKLAGEPFTEEFYGIPTKLGNDALIDEINKILREMKRSGKLKEIEDSWST